jgi:hypothetical protein
MIGPQASDEILDRSQRHGLASDLGEALERPLMATKPSSSIATISPVSCKPRRET